ncbi:MAG: hypothetical protein AB1651_19515 [Pseudomonadota bacterium]
MSELIVTHADMRSLGYCNRGAREWFTRHRLDWSRFIDEGLPADVLLANGDSMAQDVVQVATRRMNAGGEDGR